MVNNRRFPFRFPLASLAGVIAALAVGCQAPGPEIPLGHWSGDGTVIYDAWNAPEMPQADSHGGTIIRHYPTHLRVWPGTLDGREVIMLEVLSQRDRLPKLGDRTYLRVALVETARPTPNVTLYRVVAWLFNPKPDQPLTWDDNGPPHSASAIERDGRVTVQIQYMDNFADTLRFEGNTVYKSGVLFRKHEGLVHWSERLRPSSERDGLWPRQRDPDAASSSVP
jgi:hypothetical protein